MKSPNICPSLKPRPVIGRRVASIAGVVAGFLALQAQAQMPSAPGISVQTAPWQLRLEPSGPSAADSIDSVVSPRAGVTGWAVNPAGYALGMRVDVSTPRGTGLMATLPGSVHPSIDLGVRWRASAWGLPNVDVSAWYRLGPPVGQGAAGADVLQPALTTSFEMRLDGPSGARLLPKSSTIGLQIHGSGLPALRAKGGGRSVVYYRTQF